MLFVCMLFVCYYLVYRERRIFSKRIQKIFGEQRKCLSREHEIHLRSLREIPSM